MSIDRSVVLIFLTLSVGGCSDRSSSAEAARAEADSVTRVWTPEASASAPAPNVVPAPGPAEEEDSARWAAEEKAKFERRTASMQKFEDCMAQARAIPEDARPPIEAACRRLPDAPK